MADEKAVTLIRDEDAFDGVESVTVYSEDGTESQVFQAGVPVIDVPDGVLKRIQGKDEALGGYKFEVVKPSTAESRHGSTQSGEGA